MKRATIIAALWLAACGERGEPIDPQPWQLYEVEPTPESGVVPPKQVDCDELDPPPCADACTIDVAAETSDCPFDIDWSQSRFTVEMPTRSSRLQLSANICDPAGWTLHVGDSPSNNGFGGDAGEFTNDAELHFVDTGLAIYGSDRSVDAPGHVRQYEDVLAASGCTAVVLDIGDAYLSTSPVCAIDQSSDLFRLDADDIEGSPDRRWYVGMNRAYASSGRSGSGLRQLQVCITEE
jgi:hypothetical protein